MNRSWLRSILVSTSVAALVTITGCSPTPSAPQPTAKPSTPAAQTASASAAAPTSKAPPAPPKTITGDALSDMHQSMDTLYKPCGTMSTGFGAATVFDTKAGEFVTGPTPPALTPGDELVGGGNPAYLCALTGTPTDLKVFYVWYFKTPSHGLEPQKFTLMAGVGGIHEKTLSKVAALPAELGGGPSRIYSTTGGIVLSYCCRGDGLSTAAIDPETLTVRWTDKRSLASVEKSTVAFQDVFDNTVTIRDVASGNDIVLNHAQVAGPSGLGSTSYLPSGYLIECMHDNVECAHDDNLGDNVFGYYSTIAHQFFPKVFTADSSGEPQFNDGRMLLRSKKSLKLIDITTGATIFELSPAEMAAVDSYRFAAAGNYLYIANQSDSPVIDIRDRKQVSAGWKIRPVGFVGQSWVLLDPREKSTDNAISRDLVLQHVDNGVYPGPWY